MNSRDRILQNLRAHSAPFKEARSRPTAYIPVTSLSESERSDLAKRFKSELEALSGKVYIAASPSDAVEQVLSILDDLGQVDSIMAWDELPLPGLDGALAARKLNMVTPNIRGSNRQEVMAQLDPIRVGITGADAGLATTGTLVLRSGETQGRVASLLPPVHVALLRRDCIFPRLEDWIAAEGRSALTHSGAVVFATGPSRSGDIEMKVVVGVHGPGAVHVVIF